MSIGPLRRQLFAGAVALVLLPVILFAAPTDAAKAPPQPSPAEIVRGQLDQAVTLKDPVATLKDGLDFLHEQTKLNFVVNDKAFASVGATNVLSTDYTKLELPEMKDVKAKEILRTLLKQVTISPGEATYVVVGNQVVITTTTRAPYRLMEQVVSLDCEKEELSAVLKKLGRETGTNLVLDARARDGQMLVTLELQDVTLETAVVVMAETVGLKPVRIGNVVFLTTKDNAKEMQADPERAHLIGPFPLPPEFPGPGA